MSETALFCDDQAGCFGERTRAGSSNAIATLGDVDRSWKHLCDRNRPGF